MSDKWRFDPNQDYTSDDGDFGDRRSNFQRFKNRNKKRKNRFENNDSDYEDNRKRKRNWR